MKRGLSVPLFLTALVLALGTVAAACGGGGGSALTLEEYFQQLVAAQTERDTRAEALDEKFNMDFETLSEGEQLKATSDFFNESVPILSSFVDDLADVNPPAEVEDAHNEAVSAGGEVVKLARDLANRLTAANTSAEFEEVLNDTELETVGQRFDQACVALQGIADDNGIDVNLDCGDGDEQARSIGAAA